MANITLDADRIAPSKRAIEAWLVRFLNWVQSGHLTDPRHLRLRYAVPMTQPICRCTIEGGLARCPRRTQCRLSLELGWDLNFWSVGLDCSRRLQSFIRLRQSIRRLWI